MRFCLSIVVALALLPTQVGARELRVATWNLGWHVSQAEAKGWIERCGSPFAFNPATKRWEPSSSGKPGWELKWGRDAPILWDIAVLPPCDVYQANFRIVPVTETAYRKRAEQIRDIVGKQLFPDVIAFQEVSGVGAVGEILPNGGADYHICSFQGHKVQRLAFAWRRELGEAAEPCEPFTPLSLPEIAPGNQVRPGLALGLRIDGKLVRFLAVHLKSSCVSPLEAGTNANGRGALAGSDSACQVLQMQVRPLEAWVEAKASGTDHLVLLGDFNRNFWHEHRRLQVEPVRSDGSNPASPLPTQVKVRNLFWEINDSSPPATRLTLLDETCEQAQSVVPLCMKAKSAKLAPKESQELSSPKGLGCRNPIGLDHILISQALVSANASKVPLGVLGRTLPAGNGRPEPLLAVSDHCPLIATLRF